MQEFPSLLFPVSAVRPELCHHDVVSPLTDAAGIIAVGTVEFGHDALTCRWSIQAKVI